MGHFALSLHQTTFIHYTIVESHLELHLSHICPLNHSRSKTKDLSREKLVCIRSWWSVLAQVKALACYSWWLAAPRRSWWLKVFLPELANDCGSPKKFVRGLSSTTPGWWTETLSERPSSVTWEVTRLLVSVTTWIRGVCQHIDTTGKNPVVSCPLFTFKHLFSCNYSCAWP